MVNDKEKVYKKLRNTAAEMLPDSVIILGYMEHQMDLMSQLIIDVIESEDIELSGEAKDRLDMLRELMLHTSVNFDNLEHPLQSYKIPKAIENKERTRIVQDRYLESQIKAGLI